MKPTLMNGIHVDLSDNSALQITFLSSQSIHLHLPSELHVLIFYLPNCVFFLTVDPPRISQHPESKSVATGASITLTVEASGDNLRFQWMKDGKDLRDGRKYHDTNTHTLHIIDVETNDNGSYQCLVKNDVRKELSEEADLAVGKLVMNVDGIKRY